MDDREVVLRFCAFWLRGVDGYLTKGSMDAFLETTTAMLDAPTQVPDEQLNEMYDMFRLAMANAHAVFGEHAFRKWPLGATGRNPINRPLFESWSYELSKCDADELEVRTNDVVDAARRLMTYDRDYVDAITTSTGDPREVRLRFAKTAEAARTAA